MVAIIVEFLFMLMSNTILQYANYQYIIIQIAR